MRVPSAPILATLDMILYSRVGVGAMQVMLALVLLLLALVVFRVLRILFHIVRDIRAARQPRPEMHHAYLGRITLQNGVWSGRIPGREESSFWLNGDETGPHPQAVDRLLGVMDRLPELEPVALDYLRKNESEPPRGDFSLYAVDIDSTTEPATVRLEFLLDNDDSVVWFVEFAGDQPKHSGFED